MARLLADETSSRIRENYPITATRIYKELCTNFSDWLSLCTHRWGNIIKIPNADVVIIIEVTLECKAPSRLNFAGMNEITHAVMEKSN